jgi:hypothetical protein
MASESMKASSKKPRPCFFHTRCRVIGAPREVPAGGGIRNALRAQGVEERLVAAMQFDVLQPQPVQQDVVSQIQNVIALVIRKMRLQKV